MRLRAPKPIIEEIRVVREWSHVCLACRQEFRATRPHAKTCSATCRSRLHRQRKREGQR